MTHVLAIDQGTSATKAIVVDAAAACSVVAEVSPAPAVPRRRRASSRTRRRCSTPSCAPVARAPTRQRSRWTPSPSPTRARQSSPGTVPPAAAQPGRSSGRTAAPSRSAPPRRTLPRRVADLTGLVLDPYFSAPKMRWLRENVTTEGVVTTSDTWLVHRLCGAFVTDAATASRSLLARRSTT